MAQIKYSFKLKKQAMVKFPKGIVIIGEVSEYSDINGDVQVTIGLKENLPKELIKIISDDPTLISIVGVPSDMSKSELVDQSLIITNEENKT